MVWLLPTALLALLAGGLFELTAGVSGPARRVLPYALASAASVLLVILGGVGVAGRNMRLGLDSQEQSGQRVDHQSGGPEGEYSGAEHGCAR